MSVQFQGFFLADGVYVLISLGLIFLKHFRLLSSQFSRKNMASEFPFVYKNMASEFPFIYQFCRSVLS